MIHGDSFHGVWLATGGERAGLHAVLLLNTGKGVLYRSPTMSDKCGIEEASQPLGCPLEEVGQKPSNNKRKNFRIKEKFPSQDS